MTREDQALRLLLMQWLSKQLRQADTAERQAVDWPEETRAVAKLPDGTTVGTVTMAAGSVSAKVVDDGKFLAWVRENRPDQIEERVRPAYQKTVLAAVAENGELPPGVDVEYGDPKPQVRPKPGAYDALAEAWRTGQLSMSSLPELGEAP